MKRDRLGRILIYIKVGTMPVQYMILESPPGINVGDIITVRDQSHGMKSVQVKIDRIHSIYSEYLYFGALL